MKRFISWVVLCVSLKGYAVIGVNVKEREKGSKNEKNVIEKREKMNTRKISENVPFELTVNGRFAKLNGLWSNTSMRAPSPAASVIRCFVGSSFRRFQINCRILLFCFLVTLSFMQIKVSELILSIKLRFNASPNGWDTQSVHFGHQGMASGVSRFLSADSGHTGHIGNRLFRWHR